MWLDRRNIGALGVAVLVAGIGIGVGARFSDRAAAAAEFATIRCAAA